MPRKLTDIQQRCLDTVNEKGDVRIQEVADAVGCAYPTACTALLRLEQLGAVSKERLGGMGGAVLYRKIVLENPDSDDPLERLFAAPTAERKH